MPISGDEWAAIISMVHEMDNRRPPERDEMARQVRVWRTAVGVTVDSAELAIARVQEFYTTGGKWMKPHDLRPAPVMKRPADQGVGQATGLSCPWPDECGCTHTGGCVAGWMAVNPDGMREGEAERGAELLRAAEQRGLHGMQKLAWVGAAILNEFGPPPPASASVTPCPRCRGDQYEIVQEESSRDAAMIRLRKRSK